MEGFLTIDHCLRTICYFSLLFSGNFCEGGKALMEGGQSRDGGSPSPPLGKTLVV